MTTLIDCVNGVGQQVPPFFVFPGARMIDSLLEGASPGAAGTVSETGWSNTEIFSDYMKNHLLKFLPPRSDDSPVLIYSAKKVLHNWGLWQFISNTGNTRLRDLYQHLVPSLRNILFETESKSHEKYLRNKCLMVPGVGNQK